MEGAGVWVMFGLGDVVMEVGAMWAYL